MTSASPTAGVWLSTTIHGRFRVVIEYRQCSAMMASDLWYNELTVWSLDEKGGLARIEHTEEVPTNTERAAVRHCEIVERLIKGEELVDVDVEVES